ncbi:FidL-like putative membrane protein [Kosakonia arachidis]|uniref:FidL-like putative membrane protein n=1 Tax=Kosakonia arachidis TaxID=551989 RepID=A0A1I7BB97_9ENTR|nr:hypothetical protein [Kosakonia arachidis]SFT84473.1 FidL-like putative membrane protein [Kosakonia arachidis]
MIKKTVFALIAVMVVSAPFVVKLAQDKINRFNNFPFKCLSFTRYVLDDEGRKVHMNIAQDLRLYTSDRGYLLLNGNVVDGDKTSRLSRAIRLGNGTLVQGKTFTYEIKDIESLDGDGSDDKIFQLLLNEYRTGSREFQIDVFKIDKRTWLIRGPYAFINTCTRY